MKIVYCGPLPDGVLGLEPSYPFRRGVPIEVPDAFGRDVISSPDWKQVTDKPAKQTEEKSE